MLLNHAYDITAIYRHIFNLSVIFRVLIFFLGSTDLTDKLTLNGHGLNFAQNMQEMQENVAVGMIV